MLVFFGDNNVFFINWRIATWRGVITHFSFMEASRFNFLPRLCRLKILTTLTDQIHVFQTLPNNATNSRYKATSIGVLALIEPESLFVEVSEQMKRLDINVGSFDRALEQAPEVFQPVRVNVALSIANRMVDDLGNIILVHADIGAKRIGMQFRAFQDVLAHVALHLVIASGLQYRQVDPRGLTRRGALKKTLNWSLELPARNVLLFCGVLELVPASDKGFIGFDAPTHLNEAVILDGQTNTVKHEPSCFLRDTKGTTDLVGANPVLRVDDEPNGGKPLAQGQRTVTEDGSDFNRELLLAGFAVAHHPLARKRAYFGRAAMRTLHFAVRPKHLAHKVVSPLGISEHRDRFLKGFVRGFLFHTTTIAREALGVKYIITFAKVKQIASPIAQSSYNVIAWGIRW
jgi:hypothetical protein